MRNKILIIDDDSKNIFALTAVLKAKKLEVIAAPGAREGIGLLKSDSGIAVVLLDMMMPDMDGYEALREIKQDLLLRDLPVIAVTAQAMAGDRDKCLAAGADHYLSKPIDVNALLELIGEYVKTG